MSLTPIESAQAFTITGSANLAFGMEQGPSTGFALGDVAVFRVQFDPDALVSFTNPSQGIQYDNAVVSLRATVYRGGSQIYDILFVNPPANIVDTLAFDGSSDTFNVVIRTPMPIINGHEIIFAGFAFSGADIFTTSPVEGESYTFSQLFGDGTGLANAPLDLAFSAYNEAGNGIDSWHFLANSSVVPEPGSTILVSLAGMLFLLSSRHRSRL